MPCGSEITCWHGLAESGNPAPVFKSGEHDRGQGLEAQAEDGNPTVLAQSLRL